MIHCVKNLNDNNKNIPQVISYLVSCCQLVDYLRQGLCEALGWTGYLFAGYPATKNAGLNVSGLKPNNMAKQSVRSQSTEIKADVLNILILFI